MPFVILDPCALGRGSNLRGLDALEKLAWGLHLNFLRLKITSPLMRTPEGNQARGGGRKVRRLSETTSGSPGPSEAAATLTRPNLSSPGRAVINY